MILEKVIIYADGSLDTFAKGGVKILELSGDIRLLHRIFKPNGFKIDGSPLITLDIEFKMSNHKNAFSVTKQQVQQFLKNIKEDETFQLPKEIEKMLNENSKS